MDVKVSSLSRVKQDCDDYRPTHVVSMLDPSLPAERVPMFSTSVRLKRLFFFDDDDQQSPEHVQEASAAVADILTFLGDLVTGKERGSRLLVHCHAGASRSPAVAYIFFALLLGDGEEERAFNLLLGKTLKPWPSRRVIEFADEALGRGGRMLAVLDTYRASHPRRYDAYTRLNRRRFA